MEPTAGNNKGSQERHMRAVRLMRYRAVCRAMPEHKNLRQQLARKKFAWNVIALCNKRELSRVIWPWQEVYYRTPPKPAEYSMGQWRRIGLSIERTIGRRVQRGRPSNPTALCSTTA